MIVTLNNEETEEAMAFYLKEKYNLSGDPSVDIVKQPKTGNLTTTISLTPVMDKPPQSTATAQSEESTESYDSDTGDDSGDSDSSGTSETASIFGAS